MAIDSTKVKLLCVNSVQDRNHFVEFTEIEHADDYFVITKGSGNYIIFMKHNVHSIDVLGTLKDVKAARDNAKAANKNKKYELDRW